MASRSFNSPSVNETWDDPDMLATFNRDFRQNLTDVKSVKAILGTVPVAPWYAGWKRARQQALALPDELKKLGLSPAEWEAVQTAKRERSNARAAHSREVTAAKQAYTARVATADANLQTALATTDSPMMQALEIGYDDFTIQELVQVQKATDQKKEKEAILETKKRAAINAARPGGPGVPAP
jgi:uncharacterized protein (UPF0335 family)